MLTDIRQLHPRPMLNDKHEGEDILKFLESRGRYKSLTVVILETYDTDIFFKQRLPPIENTLRDYNNRHTIKCLNISSVIIDNKHISDKFLIWPHLLPISQYKRF